MTMLTCVDNKTTARNILTRHVSMSITSILSSADTLLYAFSRGIRRIQQQEQFDH